MMNFVWACLIVISVIYAVCSGNGINVADAITQSIGISTKLLLTLTGSIALWNGIMNIAQNCGIIRYLRFLLAPFLKFLFPDYQNDTQVMNAISTNMTANLIGIGNASTPAGLKAVAGMHDGSDTANRNLAVFVVINTASIQLIPTTIATIRTLHGSKSPMEIVFCVWISSFAALTTGIMMAKLLFRKRNGVIC